MTPRIPMVALAGLLLIGACTTGAADPPTPAEISEALLDVTDMDGQWDETQRQFFDERGPENPVLETSGLCADAAPQMTDLVALAGQAGADVEMSERGGGEARRLIRLQAWSNDDAAEFLDVVGDVVATCDGVSETDDAGVTVAIARITGRDVGDESHSWSTDLALPAGAGDDKFASLGRTTVARFGNVVMILQMGDVGPSGGAGALTEEQWWNIVTAAAEKLAALSDR